MVRGNWQKRVERTEARRVANKLQKEQKRAKRLSSTHDDKAQRATSYRLLSEWLDDTEFFPPDPGGEDSEEGVGQYSLVVDVWTDARPKNRQEYAPCTHEAKSDDDDFEEDEGRGGKGKPKTKDKDRGGFKKAKGKKKAHPNTKRQTEEEDIVKIRRESRSNSMSVKDDEKLCAKEFFFGKEKCPAGKIMQQRQKGSKRGNNDLENAGCSLRHYHQFPKVKSNIPQSPPLTLAQVVNGKYQPLPNNSDGSKHPASLPLKVREATLQYAYHAMFGTDDDDNALDTSLEANMSIASIYHTRIYVSDSTERVQSDNEHDGNDDKPDQRSALLDALEQLLDREKLSQTSLIYLTIQGVLVYDLNRGGLVFSEAEEDYLVSGEDIDVDAFLQYNAVDAVQSTGPSHIHEELTHHVLEDILSYLPDEAAAVLPQVCKSWRDEVGTKSPQLWKMLLNRHNWPFSIGTQEETMDAPKTDADDLDACRDAFIAHYVAARDIRAIASASSLLSRDSSDSNAVNKSGIEYAMQRYKSTTGAPQFTGNDRCAKVRVWSESVYAENVGARALAVYTHDYTLRLFEVVPRNNTSGTQSISTSRSTKCRQIACVRAIPPSLSQRKTGTYWLGGMDLDEDVVACLFYCAPENLDFGRGPSAAFLSVISRDDLACAGNEGLIDDDSLQEFDVRAMILDFLLCGADHVDHLQAALHDYISIGDGDTYHITVDVSPNLVSCGQGYFLVDAVIKIPVENDVDSDDSDDDINPHSHSGVGHRVFLLSIKKGRGKIVKAIQVEAPPNVIELHASNPSKHQFGTNAVSARKLCTNVVVRDNASILQDWLNLSIQISKDGSVDILMKAIIERRQIQPAEALGETLVVVTSNCVVSTTKSSVGICLVFVCDGENEKTLGQVVHTIEIEGSSSKILWDIFCIREEYVAVVLGGTPRDQDDDEDAVTGEWFGLDEESSVKKEVVLFHISSRREIFRCPLSTYLFCLDCIGDTIAANVSNLGFFIAGGNVREAARTSLNDESEISQTPTKTAKAKKKRLASLASGRKKDGFARGMSMRG